MKKESAKILQRKKSSVLEQWMKNQLSDDVLREDLLTNDNLRAQSEEFLDSFLSSLGNLEDTKSLNRVNEIIADISVTRAKQGFSARETGQYMMGLKDAVLQVMGEEIQDSATLYSDTLSVSKTLDQLVLHTFETFLKGREEVILRQTDEIEQISTPVIRVWDGIVALPIIGTLDSSRTQVVMENLLQAIVESGSTIAILDISGVPAVDSLVAQHLIKTVSATRLMGAECIISGIRPEIAQTVVHLGIDLGNIITKATLASALKTAFTILQLNVTKSAK